MKRFFAVILIGLVIVLSFAGCSGEQVDDNRLNVVCTIFPQYDFVREIAGDNVNLKMLLPYGIESHDFDLENLSVADITAVGKSDLFIYVGGESDRDWVAELKSTVKSGTYWLALTDTVETLNEELAGSMQRDKDHDHEETLDPDEHMWTSPKRASRIVNAIMEKLCELDGDNAEIYKERGKRYIEKINALDKKMVKVTESAKTKTLIFADRFPFRYLMADYGLSYDAAFPGCSSATDPSVAQITSLTESAVNANAKVIFYMENSNPQYAKFIAEKVGVKTSMLHSCHTVTKEQYEEGATYLSIMSDNIIKISEALE